MLRNNHSPVIAVSCLLVVTVKTIETYQLVIQRHNYSETILVHMYSYVTKHVYLERAQQSLAGLIKVYDTQDGVNDFCL